MGSPTKARVFALLTKEKHLAVLFRTPLRLAARHRLAPASPFVNLADAMCSFVRNEFPSSPAWEVLWLPGLVLEQAPHPIDQTCSFVKKLDCSAVRRQALLPSAFAQAWALQMRTSCHVIWA